MRHRPLISAAVAFAAGILAAAWLRLPAACGAALGGTALACLLVFSRWLRPGMKDVLVLLLVSAAGITNWAVSMGPAEGRRVRSGLARSLASGRTLCRATGRLSGEPTVRPVARLLDSDDIKPLMLSHFRLDVETVASNGQTVEADGTVNVSVYGTLPRVGHGDRVSVFGWLAPLTPSGRTDRYAGSQGISARMSAASPAAVRVLEEHPGSLLRMLYAAKQHFRGLIDAYCSPEAGTVMKAVLLGDRERMGREMTRRFNRSGTTHVLAISGLHVGIVYLVMVGLCRLLTLERWPRRAVVLGVVVAYAFLTGLRPATLRAMLMIVMFELGAAWRFTRDGLNTMAAAALVILVAAPHQLFEAGFQLTFVAVSGILVFAPELAVAWRRSSGELDRLVDPHLKSRWQRRRERWGRRLAATLAVCTAATLAVTPLQAYYFHIVTPVSILATALLAPLIGVLISLGFLFLATAAVMPTVAPLLAMLLNGVAEGFVGVVGLAGDWRYGHAFVAPPHPAWVVAFYGALLVVAARKVWRLPTARALAAPVGVLCAYLMVQVLSGPGSEFTATVVDVGHGTAVVMTQGRQTMIYDCGSGEPWATYDVGSGPVAGQLWAMGVKRIDVLMLSHTDSDHINGVLSLMDRFPVGLVVTNDSFAANKNGAALMEAFRQRGVPFREVGGGDGLTLGGMGVRFLWPPKGPSPWRSSSANENSLVAQVTADGRRLLLTGDIERVGMAGLMAQYPELRAGALYVPHHGSPEPVLAEFIERVAPAVAVVSAGARRLRGPAANAWSGIPTFHTGEAGTVTLRAAPNGWEVVTERRGRFDITAPPGPEP